MRSTTSISNDIEDLKEGALAELSPEKRARLGVKFRAAGEYDRLNELREAAPVKTYEVSDLDFHRHEEVLRAEAVYALWELDTGAWQFLYELKDARLREYEYENGDFGEAEESAVEQPDLEEAGSVLAAISFLVDFRGWDRFVTEDIGVALDEFLAHPLQPGEADQFIERINNTVEIAENRLFGFDDLDGSSAEELFEWADDVPENVDRLVDEKYEQITEHRGAEF